LTSYFQDAAVMSFQAEKCCHLVNAHTKYAWHICSGVCPVEFS